MEEVDWGALERDLTGGSLVTRALVAHQAQRESRETRILERASRAFTEFGVDVVPEQMTIVSDASAGRVDVTVDGIDLRCTCFEDDTELISVRTGARVTFTSVKDLAQLGLVLATHTFYKDAEWRR